MNHTDENNNSFSWTGLLLVTAFSSFIFSWVLKFLTGDYSPLFNKIAFIALGLGIVSLVVKVSSDVMNKMTK